MSNEKKPFNYLKLVKILNRVLIAFVVIIFFAGITLSGMKQEKLKYNYDQNDIVITAIQKSETSITLRINNNGNQTIRSIYASMVITNKDNDTTTESTVSINLKDLTAGSSEKQVVSLNFYGNNGNDFKKAQLSQLSFDFEIKSITFEEGQKLYFNDDGSTTFVSN